MSTGATAPSRVTRSVVLAVLLLLPLGATMDAARSGPQLHHVALGLSGPPVVTQPVRAADRSGGRDDLDVYLLTPQKTPAAAVRRASDDIRSGRLDAAVVIDLRKAQDTLLVPGQRSDDFVSAVRKRVAQTSHGFGRTVSVRTVAPASGATVPSWLPGVLVAVWCALGVGCGAALVAWRGRLVSGRGAGRRRVLLLAGAAVLLAALVSGVAAATTAVPFAPLLLLGAVDVALFGLLTLAARDLLGLSGLAVAAALLVAPAMPMLIGREPDLLPSPWFDVRSFLPHDASLRLLQHSVFGVSSHDLRAAAVIAVWACAALLTVALTEQAVARFPRPPA